MFAGLSASPLFSAPLGTGKYDGCYGNEVTSRLLSARMVAFGAGVDGMIIVAVQIIRGRGCCSGVEGGECVILNCSVRCSGNAKCANA